MITIMFLIVINNVIINFRQSLSLKNEALLSAFYVIIV